MASILEIGENNENVCQFLESYIQSGNLNFLVGSGASFPAIPVAGNIENDINALLGAGDEAGANLRSVNFIEQIDEIHAAIEVVPGQENIQAVVGRYVEFLTSIDRILFSRKNILLPRQATVFTTNYDMFLEHASSLVPSVVLNDGFERSSSLKSDAHFMPERFFDRTYRSGSVYRHQIEIPTVNLVKLHGSLSWRRKSDSLVFDPTPVAALNEDQKQNAELVAAYLTAHFLILPNLRKFHATLMERVYYDLLRLFSKAMDAENAVLMAFGFSFADEHILDIARRALRNPTSQLIIFSFDNASSTAYQAKFSKQRNVTVIAPPAGATIDLARLNSILANILPRKADG